MSPAPAWCGLALLASACSAPAERGAAHRNRPPVDWPVSIGDAGGARWSPLADVDTQNVARLTRAWTWQPHEQRRFDPGTGMPLDAGSFQATPVAIGDTLFLTTAFARAVALDASTGVQLWRFDPDVARWGPTAASHSLATHRGVALWSDSVGRRVFLTARWKLWALDASTGRPVESFATHGAADLSADLRWPTNPLEINSTSPPAIWRDLVIVGSAIGDDIIYERDAPGHVQAFDARTGRRVWRWDPLPPADAGVQQTGHANVWSFITVDTARGLVYLPVSAASNDWYGSARPGDNAWSESIVCLNARTGRQMWARQLVHHGLWDYDPAAPPTLATVTINGAARDIVVQAGKTGFLYVFDRVTGEPIWPIEERAVPPSDVPGEQASPTQPIPTWPAPFAKQGISLDDANDVLPEVHDSSVLILSRSRLGEIFTPPSLQGTVVSPGWIGGAGWGATSLDPARGMLYIKSTNLPVLAALVPDSSGRPGAPRYRIRDRDPFGPLTFVVSVRDRWWRQRRVRFPVTKAPYGTVTAIDLSSGAQLWQRAVGDPPERFRHPALARSEAPMMGAPGPSGGLNTAGGLLFLTGGSRALFALDATSGRVLWSHDLGRTSHANPMTYRTRDGRQYIVVASGEGPSAVLHAFSLAKERR